MTRGFLAALAALFAWAPANAAVTVYTDQAAFAAAAGNLRLLELRFDTGDTDAVPLHSPYRVDAFTFTSDSLTGYNDAHIDYPGSDPNNISYLGFDDARITGPRAALGFYIASYTICCDLAVGYASRDVSGTITLPDFNQAAFFGIIDTSGSIDLQLSGGNFTIAIPAMYVPVGVPEPAAWAMMILGFGAIGGMVRRRASPARFALMRV